MAIELTERKWIDINDALPVVDGLFVMTEAIRQHSVIIQGVGGSQSTCDDLLKVHVRIGVAAGFNQAGAVGFLQREICGIEGAALPGELLGAGASSNRDAVLLSLPRMKRVG